MKRFTFALSTFLPFFVHAHTFEVSTNLQDGTYVGEPGFYHTKNSVEGGLGIRFIYELETWDIFAKYAMGNSDFRDSKTYAGGVRYRVNDQHWISAEYKGLYAKEQYEVDDRILDPSHQNAITNGEWGTFAIARYQYNLASEDYPFYFGFELATDTTTTALVEDNESVLAGYNNDKYFAEAKVGEELMWLSLGLTFEL